MLCYVDKIVNLCWKMVPIEFSYKFSHVKKENMGGWEFSGWEFIRVGIFRVAIFRVEVYQVGVFWVGVYRVGVFQVGIFRTPSLHTGMRFSCKQNLFHPATKFVPGWDFVPVTWAMLIKKTTTPTTNSSFSELWFYTLPGSDVTHLNDRGCDLIKRPWV